MSDLPDNGWWPSETEAPVTQLLRKDGRNIAQVIRQTGNRWRAYSMIELNKSGTTGKPLADSVDTREEAKSLCEAYAEDK